MNTEDGTGKEGTTAADRDRIEVEAGVEAETKCRGVGVGTGVGGTEREPPTTSESS